MVLYLLGLFSSNPGIRNAAAFAAAHSLLFPEGLAVGALVHGRILLVSTYQNPIQRTIVLGVTVVRALLDGAFDGHISIVFHDRGLLLLNSGLVLA